MTQKAEIFQALKEKGPMNEAQIRQACPGIKSKSVKARLWDLRCEGFFALGEDGVYQVTSDHDPEGPEREELSRRNVSPANGHGPDEFADDGEIFTGDQDKFKALLKECGVTKAIEPIAAMFFAGDPEDLENLVQVLEDARAFVPVGIKRMLVRYWATYIERALPSSLEERLKQDRGTADSKVPGNQFMEDLGFKVEKDRDGEWVPRPSGDLTYPEALKWCATMNANRPMEREDPDEEEDTKTTRGRKRGRQEDPILSKLLDRAFPDKPEKDERDDRIQALERRLEEQESARQDDRMERLEELVAAAVNRNPIQEYMEFQTQLQALGLGSGQQHVTDTSPTVQLVKDQSDKMDKNMNRIVGVLERVMLKDHNTLAPEETSNTPEQQEAKAAELLGTMRQGARSKELRTKLWNK